MVAIWSFLYFDLNYHPAFLHNSIVQTVYQSWVCNAYKNNEKHFGIFEINAALKEYVEIQKLYKDLRLQVILLYDWFE